MTAEAALAGPSIDARGHIGTERFTFRLTRHEARQLRLFAADERLAPSVVVRDALESYGVLELAEPAVGKHRIRPLSPLCARCRTRPAASEKAKPLTPEQRDHTNARERVKRYLERRGYRVVTSYRALPGVDLLALDAHRVRAIVVATAEPMASEWPAVELPPEVSLERWSLSGGDEPQVQVRTRT